MKIIKNSSRKSCCLLILVSFVVLCTFVNAAPPGLINYQGRLTEASGLAIDGTVEITLRVFDQSIGGTLIYEENVGNTQVSNGLYSFEFGVNGESFAGTSEVVGAGNGNTNVFEYDLSEIPVVLSFEAYVDGDRIPQADYTTVYDSAANKLTLVLLKMDPAKGSEVSVQYQGKSPSILSALNKFDEHFLELVVDRITLNVRERMVSSPFSLSAKTAELAYSLSDDLESRIDYAEKLAEQSLLHSLNQNALIGNTDEDIVLPFYFTTKPDDSNAYYEPGSQYVNRVVELKLPSLGLNANYRPGLQREVDTEIDGYISFVSIKGIFWAHTSRSYNVKFGIKINYSDGSSDSFQFGPDSEYGRDPQTLVDCSSIPNWAHGFPVLWQCLPSSPSKAVDSITASINIPGYDDGRAGFCNTSHLVYCNDTASIPLDPGEFFTRGHHYRYTPIFEGSQEGVTERFYITGENQNSFTLSRDWVFMNKSLKHPMLKLDFLHSKRALEKDLLDLKKLKSVMIFKR